MSSDLDDSEAHLFIPVARETVDVIASDLDPLIKVQKVVWMRQWVDDVLTELVEDARRAGHGWESIAASLGVTRQAAWHRYRKESHSMSSSSRVTSDDILRSDDIWSILLRSMQPGRWYDLQQLYSLVANCAVLTDADREPDAPGSESPRWERNIRNVLQRRKSSGSIDWDGRARYRLKA